jgi:hypothetical protein
VDRQRRLIGVVEDAGAVGRGGPDGYSGRRRTPIEATGGAARTGCEHVTRHARLSDRVGAAWQTNEYDRIATGGRAFRQRFTLGVRGDVEAELIGRRRARVDHLGSRNFGELDDPRDVNAGCLRWRHQPHRETAARIGAGAIAVSYAEIGGRSEAAAPEEIYV